jgi:hypothetical protein
MKQFTLIISLLVMLASCGPAPTPSATPDLNATMSAFSGTMVAGTLTAQPTKTLPPTETATPLPTETATLPPTATLDPALPTATLGAALPGMPTPTAFSGAFVPGDLTIEGVTRPREIPVYLSYKVTGALNINIYMGSWQYKVEIPNKRFMTGAFKQTNKDKTTMKVYLTKIAVLGP